MEIIDRSKVERRTPLVVMVSDGTKLPTIWQYTQKLNSPAHLDLILTNKKDSKCFDFATSEGRNILAVSFEWSKESETRNHFSNRVGNFIAHRYLNQQKYLVISAGWPIVLSEEFFNHVPSENAINLHPGLLPDNPSDDFIVTSKGESVPVLRNIYGMKLFKEVFSRNIKYTGVTIHYLSREVDAGPVILREEVQVLEGDTISSLSERAHQVEDCLLPRALDKVFLAKE